MVLFSRNWASIASVGIIGAVIGVIGSSATSYAARQLTTHSSAQVAQTTVKEGNNNIIVRNQPVLRQGTAGVWGYRCIYLPDALNAGPAMCGIEQNLFVRMAANTSPLRFGAISISHSVAKPSTASLKNAPWHLTVLGPLGVNLKVGTQLVLANKTTIPLSWGNCNNVGCVADTALTSKQMSELLANKQASFHYTRGDGSPFTLNLSFVGNSVAMDVLNAWSNHSPF